MTNFIGTQLTKKGLALIAKSGLTVTFTKAETGSGIYDEKEDISTMTELKKKKQSFSINSALKKTETQANVKFVVSNKELTEGYLFTEIGLYALDQEEGEILYAVCYSTPKNATELQAYNGVFEASVIMSLLVDISNDGNVVIDPQGVYALEEDLCVTNEKLNHIADCLGDHTIKSNVPENAGFTTTTNMFKATLATTTQNGVTCTANGDGTYTLNGTAEKLSVFVFGLFDYTNTKDCYLVGCPKSGSSTTYKLSARDSQHLVDDYGVGASLVECKGAKNIEVRFVIYEGKTVTNQIFKPMITTDPFAAYDDYVQYTGSSGMLNNDVADMVELLKTYIDNTLPTGTDFNDITTEGRYYMYHTNTYTNKPPVSNGFVDVKKYGVLVKQIIWRQGTIGINDHEIYERTGLLSAGTWSDWVKVLTTKDLTTTLTATTAGSPLDATVAKDLNDKITAINTRLGTGNSSAYMTVNTGWSGTNVSSFQINQLHKVGKMVELDLALTFKVEQAAGVKSQIGTISSGILPRCEISVLTNSFAPNATNPNGTASAELRITTDGKVYWCNSTASSIPANGGMKAHAVWITN